MNLHIIETGNFKLDGGAMFGVVPKIIWEKTNPSDENNLCTWSMRCLLIEDGDQLILIDTGIGNKQNENFLKYYYLHGEASLTSSINKAGFSLDDVTDVFLTHLHFDHCGGAVNWKDRENQIPEMAFKNAKYWTNKNHWQWATEPNSREKASFLKENLLPLQESGQLHFMEDKSPFRQFDILYVDGHTEKMMLPHIQYKGRTIVYAADLLPSVGHIPLAYVMGYDTRPLLTMEEKDTFLKEAVSNEYIIFFEHDSVHQCCTIQQTIKGVRVKDTFPLKDITG